ncbi:uncharacterized protein LY89DRAFT_505325 [Mollisia scopiformis]|uniref:Amino acid permease/ SLC12A domain-containing protein n=1 Tax=Mollisia scopiformis TaxID=149040 RepID=A0A194XF64_MOLSC|nr:uncharacterized protein LY89DRAFT_505325 [Mollisia scopiformis]KUJ18808.1 hypothetical protein LY89DRAFT_505325 [Mollisia scopiformis]
MAALVGEDSLLRQLTSWQILFIAIGGTVGIGFATTSGEVLAISGPGGLLIAFAVVGLVTIFVMEGISEMIVLWPIPNAMMEFVAAFVDRDLAVIVGIAYWYTNAVTLAAIIIGAADLLDYWDISFPILNVVFVAFLLGVLGINAFGVKVFGWVELAGGIIKVLLVTTIFIIMICINAGVLGTGQRIGAEYFADGVRNNPEVAHSHIEAVLMCIPLAIFSYIGVELITVTAFEARTNRELQFPSKHIAVIIFVIYMVSIGGFAANIEWFNQNLPQFLSQDRINVTAIPAANLNSTLGHFPRSWQVLPNLHNITAAPVVAVMEAGVPVLPGLLIGFLIYSGMSAANTALYVSSRTLYGLTRQLRQDDDRFVKRTIAKLNTVSPKTRVPIWALIFSCFIFAGWLPFAHFQSSFTQEELKQTLVAIGSVSCVLVWASQCLAFIQYNKWLWKHKQRLRDHQTMNRFDRWHPRGFSTYLVSLQPFPAYAGLISCLIIVVVLNAISMINGEKLLFKALVNYLGPAILITIFTILKIVRRRTPGWVTLGDFAQLRETLLRLDGLIEGGRPITPPEEQGGNVPQLNYNPPYGGNMGPPPVNYGSGYQNNGYAVPPYQNGTVIPPRPNPSPAAGFAMPPTAAQIERQGQGQNSQNHPSYQSLDPRSQSPNADYELHEFGSPVSPVGQDTYSEVHSESATSDVRHGSMVSTMDERLTPGLGYARNDAFLDAGYPRQPQRGELS